MSARPGVRHFTGEPGHGAPIRQGDTFTHSFTFVDANGAHVSKNGVTLLAQLRPAPESSTLSETFTTAIAGASNHVITISLSAAETAALTAARYVWDLQETTNGVVTTRLAGDALVVTDVSRV